MLLQVAKENDLYLKECVVIGDRWTDMLAAQEVGCTKILVKIGVKKVDEKEVPNDKPRHESVSSTAVFEQSNLNSSKHAHKKLRTRSPDEVNDLINSGYTTPHLAEGLRYTFTSKEAKSLGVLGVGLVSRGAWNVRKFAKKKFDNRKKENL